MLICTKCKLSKPATAEFYGPDKRRPSGFQSQCRECRNLLKRMDYQENRSARLAGVAEYRKNNREKIRLFFSAFNKSPERIAYLRRHREEKKEHYQAMHREWCRNNRKRANERIYRYRRARALATPRWLSPEQKAEIRKAYISARKSGLTVDHIVPIQGKNVSGLHVPWNLQTLPLSDNCSKGRRLNE